MILLLLIGFVAGVITAVSPCVLPVLPIVLAGGASGGRRRPYAIIAGLVASFTLFTLTASALLSALGLPQDLLRNIAIALLFVVAATLFVPRLGMLIERPLSRLSRRPSGDLGGGCLSVPSSCVAWSSGFSRSIGSGTTIVEAWLEPSSSSVWR